MHPVATCLDGYVEFRTCVTAMFQEAIKTSQIDERKAHDLLNGAASEALRRDIKKTTRTQFGIFFSGEELSTKVASRLAKKIKAGASIADPACGAGDLLLACLIHAELAEGLKETLDTWGARTFGTDIHHQLTRASRERIALLAASRLIKERSTLLKHDFNLDLAFPNIYAADYLNKTESTSTADCVVMNPPFVEVNTPEGCKWSSGKVQQAALFTAAVVEAGKTSQEIVAILPDVLRSGTRYERWRQMIEVSAEIVSVESYGRFDSKTDVDVFIVHLRKRASPANTPSFNWIHPPRGEQPREVFKCIGDAFKVSVGSVVPHKHEQKKEQGPWQLYIDVSSAPKNGETSVSKKKRYIGKLHKGPFVAIRRTSSPSDKNRAVGTLVKNSEYIAVENHLIVARPKDGTLKQCRALMRQLQEPAVNDWLNQVIRCRHLTTAAVESIPYGDTT